MCAAKVKRKNQLLASRSNKLKRFGEHVPDLLDSIAEAYAKKRFLKKPVGPIGRHQHGRWSQPMVGIKTVNKVDSWLGFVQK